MRPYISQEKCTGCKECIYICPYDVFTDEDGIVSIPRPEDCIECASCVDNCPEHAIYMDD
ncbi:MAG: 4Fe-4S binding protein [Syntrophorhabdaceae bacterium]|nr:4Fe-4S binding protein [Syntrophorhabdaceae bacterium]